MNINWQQLAAYAIVSILTTIFYQLFRLLYFRLEAWRQDRRLMKAAMIDYTLAVDYFTELPGWQLHEALMERLEERINVEMTEEKVILAEIKNRLVFYDTLRMADKLEE